MTTDRTAGSRREELARRAARAMLHAPGLDADAAIREVSGATMPDMAGGPPRRSEVHRHLEAMIQEHLGQAAFEDGRRHRIRLIVEVLDLLDYLASPDAIDVAGRTARGYLVGPVLVFARCYGGHLLEPLADELEASGIEEVRCLAARTRHGHLGRLQFDSDGIRFNVTRCPRTVHAERDRDLFSGEEIAVLSLEELRTIADEGFSPGRP